MLCYAAERPNNNVNPSGLSEKSVPFVQLYKECTICAILRVNTPNCLAATEAKTCWAMLCNAVQRPINNPNASGLSEKKVYCLESLQFCR